MSQTGSLQHIKHIGSLSFQTFRIKPEDKEEPEYQLCLFNLNITYYMYVTI